jgi:hypothetical protein
MEKSQRSASVIETHRELTQNQMTQSERVLGILALVGSCTDDKRMEFVIRDLNAAINIRRYAELKTKPAEL